MKKGFTLIELLAVIIILGILMLIAIPSVTSYINNSRKESYIDTVNEIIKGATMLVNSGEFEVNDTNTTYYIPTSAIDLENGEARSPYGKFEPAYVVVTYDGDEYDYYYIGKDEADMGTDTLIKSDNLDKDSIKSGITSISTDNGIGNKEKIVVFKDDGSIDVQKNSTKQIDGDTGEEIKILCKRATTLHTETCNQSSFSCSEFFDYGDTITYGNLGTRGVLSHGDAFDCDVNYDGVYDSTTERFYYVSPYYEGQTNSFDNTKAVLIYYRPVEVEVPYARTADMQAMHPEATITSLSNLAGPVTIIKELPTTDTWKHPSIIKPGERYIVNEEGTTVIAGEQIINPIDYGNKAARLLTVQELRYAFVTGERDYDYTINRVIKDFFIFEKTNFSSSSNYNHYAWMETPSASHDTAYYAYEIDPANNYVGGGSGVGNSNVGTRAVITALVSNIQK